MGAAGTLMLVFAVLLLGELNAPLDFADVLQILGDAVAVVRAQPPCRALHLAGDGVENAALALDARQALSARWRRRRTGGRTPRAD